ncbi:MAG: alpha/beta fold hydrolase [Sandaracinus sp.]
MTTRDEHHASSSRAREPEILVTGATGFVGRWLLASLTRDGHVVAALVRHAATRGPELSRFVARLGGDPSRLVVLEGDVEREGLGLAQPLSSVRVVHHLAARFSFGLSRADAHATNVVGTERVVRWAATLPRLERFVFLGGYRMTAHPLASLDARAIERHYAAGAYEGSKIEAYVRFRALADELSIPWTAVHPSGVIGDARTGETTQTAGLGDTVKALFEGRLPALAGSARTFVPVVTVDFLADYLASVPARAESRGQDLVVFDPASPALPELVRTLARTLGVEAPSITLPVGFVRALPSAWTGLDRESAGFLVEDRYDTRAGDAHAAAMGLRHPSLEVSLARWCAYLVSSRFLARDEASREATRFEEGAFVVDDPRTADVVLLHGIPFDAEAMKPLSDALEARGLSCARLDLPGLGRSGPHASEHGTLDPAWLARRLAGRTREVVLVGHSLGAALATLYAETHPETVRALGLVAPAFLAAPAGLLLRIRPAVAHVLGGLDAQAFRARFLAERSGDDGEEAITSALASLARSGGASRYAAALAEAASMRGATLRAYAAVRARGVPITIVHADEEPLVEDTLGAEVATVAGAGHNPHLTHTAHVVRALEPFGARSGSPSRPRSASA